MRHKGIFILFFIIFLSSYDAISQPVNYVLYGNIYERGNSKIELWIKPPKTSCGLNAKKFKYILIPRNLSNSSIQSTPYLSWKIDIVNCEGYLISKFWCEDVSDFLNQSDDQPWERKDFDFDADFIESRIHSNSITSYRINGKDMNLGFKETLLPAVSISGPSSILKNETVNLSVIGGSLTKGANWYWYKDNCNQGIPFATGSQITVTPDKSTKYFVRAEFGSKKTTCTEFSLVVDNNSTAPLGIVSDDDDLMCEGTATGKKLSINGGKLGYKAEWVWYENSLSPSNQKHRGSSYTVKPSKTTTYFVRAESDFSDISAAVQYTVRVVQKSIPPTSIEVVKSGLVCEGDLIELKIKGGKLGESSEWIWQKTTLGGISTKLGEGETIDDNATETSTYAVYANGACEPQVPQQISIKIDVNLKSIAPLSSSITVEKLKRKNIISFPSESGRLGTNAKWVWYKNQSATEVLTTGNQFISRSVKDKSVYLRAEGECNTSELVPVFVKGLEKKRYTFFNISLTTDAIALDPNRISNLQLTVGTQGFYVKASLAAPSLFGNKADDISSPTFEYDGTRITNFPPNTGSYYSFNEKIYSNLRLYSIGVMAGKKALKYYFGAGYGLYDLSWGVNTYKYGTNALISEKWASYPSKSLSGPSLETGFFLKFGPLNFMGGINGVYSIEKSQQYISGQLGIGLSF